MVYPTILAHPSASSSLSRLSALLFPFQRFVSVLLVLSGLAGVAAAPSVAQELAASNRERLIGTFTARPSTVPPSQYPRGGYLTVAPGTAMTSAETFRREAGDRVFFPSNSAELGGKARAVLSAQADWLRRRPSLRITIVGHADDGGSMESNLALSAARAEAVRERLIADGIEPQRIAIAARGREDRIAPCDAPACGAQNRRVESIVHATVGSERLGYGEGGHPAGFDSPRRAPQPR